VANKPSDEVGILADRDIVRVVEEDTLRGAGRDSVSACSAGVKGAVICLCEPSLRSASNVSALGILLTFGAKRHSRAVDGRDRLRLSIC
jgi:hypothetical protein